MQSCLLQFVAAILAPPLVIIVPPLCTLVCFENCSSICQHVFPARHCNLKKYELPLLLLQKEIHTQWHTHTCTHTCTHMHTHTHTHTIHTCRMRALICSWTCTTVWSSWGRRGCVLYPAVVLDRSQAPGTLGTGSLIPYIVISTLRTIEYDLCMTKTV